MTTVDARGKLCPQPLIMTKKALQQIAVGDQLTILIDDDVAVVNVTRFLEDNGHSVERADGDGEYRLLATKSSAVAHTEPEAYCPLPTPSKSHAICVRSDRMGVGADELGEILMKALMTTIVEVDPLPGAVVFYNSGINLALNGSPAVEALKELEARGITILVCGTCLDYYGKKNEVAVGTISNMYDILDVLSKAGHVVYP